MTDTNDSLTSAESAGQEGMTHVISQGGFKTVESQRKRLASNGVTAKVICPPGVNTNG